MLIDLKILGGKSCQLNVPEDARVKYLKDLVEKDSKIPKVQQKLVFKGKTLADDKQLTEYGIVTGSKLNLVVVKKSTTATTQGGESSTKSAPKYTPDDFWVALEKVLKRRFPPEVATSVYQQYQRDYKKILTTMSLDDIERVATRHLSSSSSTSS